MKYIETGGMRFTESDGEALGLYMHNIHNVNKSRAPTLITANAEHHNRGAGYQQALAAARHYQQVEPEFQTYEEQLMANLKSR